MKRTTFIPTETLMAELVHRAKLNKPSNDWKTSEWDRAVELVAEAMQKPVPQIPSAP